MERPWWKFCGRDWLGDQELHRCSIGARGLWISMLCLMNEGTPYGHLSDKKGLIGLIELSKVARIKPGQCQKFILELEENHVFSKTPGGLIFSRRMVRDESLRMKRSEGGYSGGNPKLTTGYNKAGFIYLAKRSVDGAIKIGIAINPQNRMYKLRASVKVGDVDLVTSVPVDDMGASEAVLHGMFASKRVHGEWFLLNSSDIDLVKSTLKGNCPLTLKGRSDSDSDSDSGSGSSPEEGSGENPLYLRYHDLIAGWENPDGVDFGFQIWIMYVDDGTITTVNVHEIFDGLARYLASEKFAKGFRVAVNKWLSEKRWKDHPKPAMTSNSSDPYRRAGGAE